MARSRDAALAEIEAAAREVAATLGLEIVEFVFHSRGKHSQLRIDVDRPGPRGVGLQDCETLSRALDDRLESSDFFEAAFELQVSSPGLDRPIRSDDDLRRNAGRTVRVEFRDETGRHLEATGILGDPSPGGVVRIEADEGVLEVQRDRISLLKQSVTSKGRSDRGR